jgi:predicted flap endonuclease-1-like 5' DNA nuclease
MDEQDLTTLEGIGEAIAKKLQNGGIHNIDNLAVRSENLQKDT